MKPTKNKVATPTAVATPVEPSSDIDWSTYAGAVTGFENMTQDDLGIPLLSIIQPKSPEVDRTHKDYPTKAIVGAGAGDIFNTVSRKVIASFGKSVAVVPCGYERTFVEWKPRASGGGIVRVHRNAKILEEITGRDDKGKDVLRNGNNLATTGVFYVLVLQDGEKPLQAVINMTSTQLKHARFWMNLMTGLRVGPNKVVPPMFSHSYNLSSIIEQNDQGSWYGWKIEVKEMVKARDLIEQGQRICQQVAVATRPQLRAPAPDAPADDEVPM